MEAVALEQKHRINASRDRVWEALFNPDQLVKWLVPNLPDARMKRDAGDKIMIQFGPVSVDLMTVEAADAPIQLMLRSLPDQLITTTYNLEEDKSVTTVTVRMAGFESLAESAQQARLRLSNVAWEQTLKNLDAFVCGKELPFPKALVAPLFGYWREAKTTLSTDRSIWIDAPRERVWKAVTDPVEIQRWMSPAIPWGRSALEVGGRFYVLNEETNAEMYVEIIELLDAPNQLMTRTVPEPPDTVVKGKSYTLQDENGGTRLTVTVSGYEKEPEETRWSNMEQDTLGLGLMLQNTKAHIEGYELPHPQGF